MRNRLTSTKMNDLDLCLEVVSRSRQPLRYIWRWLFRKPLEIFRDKGLVPHRPQSRGLESLTAGLQSLRLASRLKPWLRTIDGLGWLMATSHGLQVQTRNLTAAN